MGAARDLAQRIAANPGPALRMAKRLLREGQHTRLDTLLDLSSALQGAAHHTAEHTTALDGFLASMRR
jgi:enoyl-CoA hydratase/carnithine racemase